MASTVKVMVPVDARDPVEPPASLVEMLGPHQVFVLGYYEVPDQSTTDQLREQFGGEAEEAVAEVAESFREAGAAAEYTVVFTHDRGDTIENVAAEENADAVLTEGFVDGGFERVLVPIRGDRNLENIVAFVEKLVRESDAEATFLHVSETEDDASEGELIVRGAADRLEDVGVDAERVHWRQVRGSTPDAILDVADEFDLLVVGETEPSLKERIFGQVTGELRDRTDRSMLVVRN